MIEPENFGVKSTIVSLKKRSDFLRLRSGNVAHASSFVLQSQRRNDEKTQLVTPSSARVGLTVSKRVGNAVVRNRVRRRFRGLLQSELSGKFKADSDYVIIARESALRASFKKLGDELSTALERVNTKNHIGGSSDDRSKGGHRNAKPKLKPSTSARD